MQYSLSCDDFFSIAKLLNDFSYRFLNMIMSKISWTSSHILKKQSYFKIVVFENFAILIFNWKIYLSTNCMTCCNTVWKGLLKYNFIPLKSDFSSILYYSPMYKRLHCRLVDGWFIKTFIVRQFAKRDNHLTRQLCESRFISIAYTTKPVPSFA